MMGDFLIFAMQKSRTDMHHVIVIVSGVVGLLIVAPTPLHVQNMFWVRTPALFQMPEKKFEAVWHHDANGRATRSLQP